MNYDHIDLLSVEEIRALIVRKVFNFETWRQCYYLNNNDYVFTEDEVGKVWDSYGDNPRTGDWNFRRSVAMRLNALGVKEL